MGEAVDRELEAVRAEADPLVQARMATELLNTYAQRGLALGQVRRAAIQRARRERRMGDTEIAKALGLTKGRLSQIMHTADALGAAQEAADREPLGGPVVEDLQAYLDRLDRRRGGEE